jgi:hypothetical protein
MYIDLYCERTEIGFFNEPLNAITNLAFIIAAYLAYDLAKKRNTLGKEHTCLIIIMALIGVGSFLFHTLANSWSMLADTIPILLFQVSFLYIYSSKIMNLTIVKRSILMLAFLMSVFAFGSLPQHLLNGSIGYMPAIIFLTALGIYHYLFKKTEQFSLLLASFVFLCSLTFRTLDNALCETIPFGIHFLWHCLNSIVLYLAVRTLIVNEKT